MSWEYVITDMAGAHFWAGDGFIPIDQWDLGRDDILRYPSEDEARQEVVRQRKKGNYLKVIRQTVRQAHGTSYLLAQEDLRADELHRLN
jgi:hypothetical protein